MNLRFNSFLVLFSLFAFSQCQTDTGEKAGNPILLLATQDHFGAYTKEILLTEGFNAVDLDSLGGRDWSADKLDGYDLVILAQSEPNQAQSEALRRYVENGGNLIAFRPTKPLYPLFGITEKPGSLSDGYISMDAGSNLTDGFPKESLQFHGSADLYQMTTGKLIASLLNDTANSAGAPALVMNSFEKGRTFAFAYNLPESIVLTRQGNPADAGKEMDGITGIRSMDLFTGGWVNSSKNTLNQADEQMRLLSRCIETATASKRPMPRLWYFPDSLNCLVTLNNDGEDSKEAEFTPQFEDVDAKGAKMTLYIKETDRVSAEWVKHWSDKGFEMAGHPNDTHQATAPDWNTMDSVLKELKGRIKTKYGIADLHTNTNHWFVWVGKHPNDEPDHTAMAKLEEEHGIRLDCNYAHYDNGSKYGHFLGRMGTEQGNYTGSGLAMKFADMQGRTVNVYQQLNNVYDQQYMENKDRDGYFNAFKGLMDRSLEKDVFSCISVRAHNNEYYFSKIPLMKMLDYANSKKVPVWTEVNLLRFLQAKDEARFTEIQWKNNELSFILKSGLSHSNGITIMLPGTFGGSKIRSITEKDAAQPYRLQKIKGVEYAMLTVQPGSDHAIKANY